MTWGGRPVRRRRSAATGSGVALTVPRLGVSLETRIGIGVTALAVAAMAVDHLMGDDPGLEDPPMFLIASALSLIVALIVFGRVVPRAKADDARAERAAKVGLVLSLVALVLGPPTLWLGLPFVLAGGGVALGLLGRGGQRSRRATAAIVIGSVVLLLATSAYLGQAVSKLS